MLKGIDPILTPELLGLLAEMGHGDVLAVVDRNYPAYAPGLPVVELAVDLPRAIEAICSVMPIDSFVESPVRHMLTDDGAEGPALPDVRAASEAAEGRPVGFEGLARPDFYPAAHEAYAVVRTIEDRPYACYLIAKGVV